MEKLVEDGKIRKYLNVRLAKASISKNHHRAYAEAGYGHISTARPVSSSARAARRSTN